MTIRHRSSRQTSAGHASKRPAEKAGEHQPVPITPDSHISELYVALNGPFCAPLPTTDAHPHPNPSTARKAATVPLKALYRVSEAMVLLSMSRTVIYEQMRAGRLRSVHQGRARLIPAGAIADYVALLEAETTTERAA